MFTDGDMVKNTRYLTIDKNKDSSIIINIAQIMVLEIEEEEFIGIR